MNAIANPTTDASLSLPASFRWTILGAPLLILFGSCLLTASRLTATPQANFSATADDWRRTANGWERIHAWPTAASRAWPLFSGRQQQTNTSATASHAATRPSHLDTHPAALALAQLVAS